MQKTIRQITKNVLSAIFWVILIFLIIAASWIVIDKHVRKSAVPSFLGYSALTIVTGSMSGTIEVDDLIIIKDKKEYKIGDIVTYMKEGDKAPTTHRIILYDENGNFITKGDANNTRDAEPVSKDEVLGKVVFTIPAYGIFFRWITQENGWLYIASSILIFALGGIILKSENSEEALATEGSSDLPTSGEQSSNNISGESASNGADSLPESTSQTNSENSADSLPQEDNETGEENK